MSDVLRLADPITAAAYPMPCHGQAQWQSCSTSVSATIHLGRIDPGSIVVPSLAILGEPDHRFQFALLAGAGRWQLNTVPADSAAEPFPDQSVTTHIDCYHVHEQLEDARLEVEVRGLAAVARYLLTCSTRPIELEEVKLPTFAAKCSPPPAISQMGEPRIGPRICSPTSVAMVLSGKGIPIRLSEISADCFDPVTNLYGSWPMAIRAATQHGVPGAVEVFESWDQLRPVLGSGLPFVASIRFARGQLPGAPLPGTGGHLVVVYGCSPEQIWVNDPAAASADAVPRTYDAAAFTRAWLAHRGAAYILAG